MKTTVTEMREEPATILCGILARPVKRWFLVIALVLLFMALCVVVFAGEPGQQSGCDLQSGLAGTLSLSQTQCESLRQLADQFSNDTATTRSKIMEKRFELRRLSQDPKAGLNTINRVEKELNALEQEFYRKAQRTEAEQRRLLSPEQIKQIKDTSYGNGK